MKELGDVLGELAAQDRARALQKERERCSQRRRRLPAIKKSWAERNREAAQKMRRRHPASAEAELGGLLDAYLAGCERHAEE